MKIDLKGKKGFTSIDLTLAMLIIIVFVVIMTSVSYNVYLSSIEAKRTAVALNYAVDIFENIGLLDFSDVSGSYEIFDDVEGFDAFLFTNISSNGNVETVTGTIGTYEIELEIEDYKSEGILKLVTLTITYPVSRKNTETLVMQRIKTI